MLLSLLLGVLRLAWLWEASSLRFLLASYVSWTEPWRSLKPRTPDRQRWCNPGGWAEEAAGRTDLMERSTAGPPYSKAWAAWWVEAPKQEGPPLIRDSPDALDVIESHVLQQESDSPSVRL